MNQTLLALSLGLASIALVPRPAFPQNAPQCGARDAVVLHLAERYGETRRSWGLAQNAVVEVYASDDSGTWTIAVTTPDGQMCLVAAGQGYQPEAPQTPAMGERI